MSSVNIETCWGDPEIEISATVQATPVRCDYGVPHSPVWTEYEDPEIEYPILLDGEEFARSELLTRFGPEAVSEIEASILDTAYSIDNWE